MTNEEILQEIRKIKLKLENIDFFSFDGHIRKENQKMINEAFNDLEKLERKINT